MKNQNLWIHGWVLFCAVAWWALGALLTGCQYVSGGSPEVENGTMTFLDVGQGLSVLLEYDGRYALYDAGPDSMGFIDTLRNRGIDSLDWVMLSHNHRDHLGGMLEVLAGNAIYIGHLYVGPDAAGGFLVDSVLRAARRSSIPIDTVGRGDQVILGDVSLSILWPPKYLRVAENGASLVAKVELVDVGNGDAAGSFGTWVAADGSCGGGVGIADAAGCLGGVSSRGVLLTGDLDSIGETRLLEMGVDVSAELLQVGHHGSAHSSTLGFLSRVAPRYAVISVGAENSYGHPTETVLRKLQYVLGDATGGATGAAQAPPNSTGAAPLYRTDLHGSVSFQLVPGVGVVQ